VTSDFEQLNGGLNFSQLLNFGATYSLSFTPDDQTFVGENVNQTINQFQISTTETLNTGIGVRYEMPLLKNFGRDVNTERLVLARSNLEISNEELRDSAMGVAQSVEGAYWDIVAGVENLRTAELALKRAEDLLALNRKKVEVGTLAPIEITQAEAGVAERQEGVIVADVRLRNAEDELRRLMAIPAADPAWEQVIVASDRPDWSEKSIDVDGALAIAMERRPEVINARKRVSQTELSERVARKQTRHELDLDARLGPSRNKRDAFLEFPLTGNPATATSEDTDTVGWQVGVTYSLPLKNREAKSNRAIATLNRKRSEINLLDVEQTVRVDVRTAVRNVDSGFKRVEAARKNVELQTKKLDAEQKKFDNGMSTSFEVLTFQNDLADAELRLIEAGLDYAKFLTAVERAKGTLLEARGLTLDE
jgi:outer membrane protein TolC